jgi:ribose transport system ATP-binding protein
MKAINKAFPGVRALDHVDFGLVSGEVHALLGENGAGKSTLMKILSGSLPKDSGRILLDGKDVTIESPFHARELGIGMVYQELSLIPSLSVAENIFLGRLPRKRNGLVDWVRMRTEAWRMLETLGLDLDPTVRTGSLGMAERQLIEIAKTISQNIRILVLDEPTSALTDTERDRLFAIIRRLQEHGVSVIYISHRLAEVVEIAGRATVLRDGKNVGVFSLSQVDEAFLARAMVGRELRDQFPVARAKPGSPALSVHNLTVGRYIRDVSFDVHKAEIVGIFGLMGSGRSHLARALFGLERVTAGEMLVNGIRVNVRSPRKAIALGIGYLTEDRRDGLVPSMGVASNVTLASLGRICRSFFLSHRKETDLAARYVRELSIATPSLEQRVQRLSGGNQQKVVLAKWLCGNSSILVFHEPTRGIDVGAKAEVFQLMRNLTQQGAGIVMISSEMPEIIGMSDRILVMSRGRIVAEYHNGDVSQEELLKSAGGIGGK